MRRSLLLFAVLTSVAFGGAADAHVMTLAEPTVLRAGPGLRHRIVATAPAGAALDVRREGVRWTRVSFDGRQGYVATERLVAEPPAAAAPIDDPTCDYGYPYSGSGLYFADPLTELRHGEPLGFFFGYHRRYPC